jgi:hypothetical protein
MRELYAYVSRLHMVKMRGRSMSSESKGKRSVNRVDCGE